MKLRDLNNAFDSDFQQDLISKIEPSEDLRNYLLTSREIGEVIQEDIDMIVTDGKLNDTVVKQRLDDLYKNLLRRQNLCEVVF